MDRAGFVTASLCRGLTDRGIAASKRKASPSVGATPYRCTTTPEDKKVLRSRIGNLLVRESRHTGSGHRTNSERA